MNPSLRDHDKDVDCSRGPGTRVQHFADTFLLTFFYCPCELNWPLHLKNLPIEGKESFLARTFIPGHRLGMIKCHLWNLRPGRGLQLPNGLNISVEKYYH